MVLKLEGVTKIFWTSVETYNDGMKLDIEIEVKYGLNIQTIATNIKNTVLYAMDNAAGINVFGINIRVKSISR